MGRSSFGRLALWPSRGKGFLIFGILFSFGRIGLSRSNFFYDEGTSKGRIFKNYANVVLFLCLGYFVVFFYLSCRTIGDDEIDWYLYDNHRGLAVDVR